MRRFIIHTVVVLFILLLGLSPFIGAMVAGSIAAANGCELHEGFVNPCIIDGVDRGEDLYMWGVLAWFGIATIPLAVMAALIYITIVVIVWLVQRNRRKRSAAAAVTAPAD